MRPSLMFSGIQLTAAVGLHQRVVRLRHADEPAWSGRNRSAACRSASRTDSRAQTARPLPAVRARPDPSESADRPSSRTRPPTGFPSSSSPLVLTSCRKGRSFSRPTRASSSPNAGAMMDDAGTVGHGDVAVGTPRATRACPQDPSGSRTAARIPCPTSSMPGKVVRLVISASSPRTV